MDTFLITAFAGIAALFLIAYGAVSDQAAILSIGTGILGTLLGHLATAKSGAAGQVMHRAAASTQAKALDLVARIYYWIYCTFCQRPPGEPWTRQAARFEQRWPVIAWGLPLAVLWALAHYLTGGWEFATLAAYLFAFWFGPHLMRYRVAHPDNLPYQNKRLLRWSMRRLGILEDC